jgi:iron complex transport system ATP-binding protein
MIEGIEVAIDSEAVVVTASEPLTVLSSAFVGGGFAGAHAIVNLHVRKNIAEAETDGLLSRFVERREIRGPWVGLLTSAWTENAVVAEAAGSGMTALAVATVGLSNRITAGRTPLGAWAPSTINTAVVVDAAPEPAALVNAVMTVTEVKTSLLASVDLRCDDGSVASGTSTDAVVVAATGRGLRCRFGGPISDLGWVVARAAREALDAGIRRWIEAHR